MHDLKTMSEKAILQAIGQSLKGSRIAHNMTMKELAKKSEIGVVSLSRIENGQTNPTILTLLKVFKALGREKEIAQLFPDPTTSPIYKSKMAKKEMKPPQRVRKKKSKTSQWTWNVEGPIEEVDIKELIDRDGDES